MQTWTNDDLIAALDRYEVACEGAGLQPTSVFSYVDYARRFLRWRTGEYRPRDAVRPSVDRAATPATSSDLNGDLRTYENELQAASLQPRAVQTYVTHARQFVRWLDGTFLPGSSLRARSITSSSSREISGDSRPRRAAPTSGPPVTEIDPWLHGAVELIQEGSERLNRGSDADKRRALVLFDEAIEQSIRIYGSIPRELRHGLDVPPERLKQAQGRYFSDKLEFLDWYLAASGRPVVTPLTTILWYHSLRNEIYHSGNGMVPEMKHVVGARRAAVEVVAALFGPAAAQAPQEADAVDVKSLGPSLGSARDGRSPVRSPRSVATEVMARPRSERDDAQGFMERHAPGVHPVARFPRTMRAATPDESQRGVVVGYSTANWTVYRAVVERLGPNERFHMETQFGPFEMSRQELEESFPGVVHSESYRTGPPSQPNSCYYVQGPPPPRNGHRAGSDDGGRIVALGAGGSDKSTLSASDATPSARLLWLALRSRSGLAPVAPCFVAGSVRPSLDRHSGLDASRRFGAARNP